MPETDNLWIARVFFVEADEPEELMHFRALTRNDACGALKRWVNTRYIDAAPIRLITYQRVRSAEFGPLGERKPAIKTATYIAYARPENFNPDDTDEYDPRKEREHYEPR